MTTAISSRLAENLERIRARVTAACERAGRSSAEVTVVAVTKYAELEWVRALVELGVTELGESRPQQLIARAAALPPDLHWHMIGHLQRNKVDLLLPAVSRIHSVDSIRLLEAIQREAAKQGLRPKVLLEVNVSGEQSKDGFNPTELISEWDRIISFDRIAIDGLMTMAPLDDDIEKARPVFRTLRELRDRLRAASHTSIPLPHLSMGMSGDFEVGIEEGATLVRIGSGLFEGLASDDTQTP